MRYPVSTVSPLIRWLIALSWTLLVIILLLKPGDIEVVHEYSFADFFESFFTYTLSRWGMFEAFVHVILFIILTTTWFWVLNLYYVKRNVLIIVISIAVALGTATEILQYFVNRGSLFIDLLANYLGVLLFIIFKK